MARFSRGSSLQSLLRRIALSSLSSCASLQRPKQRLFLSLFPRKTRDDRPHSMHVFRGKSHRVYLSAKFIYVMSSIAIFYYVDAKHIIDCPLMPFGTQEMLRNSSVPFKEQQSTGPSSTIWLCRKSGTIANRLRTLCRWIILRFIHLGAPEIPQAPRFGRTCYVKT